MAGDGLLLDVADAVASGQRVDWDRAHRTARLDQCRALDNLRVLSGMFAAVEEHGTPGRPDAASIAGITGDPRGTSFLRFALGALVAVAALQVAAALLTIAWSWEQRFGQQFAEPRMLALVSLSACALLLLVGGRRDHRARLLGVVFALGASSFSSAFAWPLASLAASEVDPWILPEVFQPALMWAFAREFPRVHRLTGIDDLARRMAPLSAWIGGGLWIANLPFLPEGWLPFLHRRADGGVYWLVLSILTLSAVSAIVWRARETTAHEARRVALLIGGIVVGSAPVFLDMTIELLWPAARRFGDEHRDAISAVVFTFLLSTPCSMTYAVLAERALDVRTVVRSSYRRLLTRRLLGAMIAAPLGALGWLLASQPDRTFADVMASSSGRLLAAAVGAGALTAGCRKRLLVLLDAWVHPETMDHRRLLMAAGSELVRTTSVSHIGEVVTVSVRRGCGAPGTLLVSKAAEVSALHFTAPTADLAPLARTSAIAHALESTREPIRVDPDDGDSVFALLPSRDAEWVVAAAATAILPVFGPGSEVLALMAVGRRFDDGRLSRVDLDFLHALAATVGLALARVRLAAGRPDAPPASECPACGIVASAGPVRPCGCGVDYAAAPVPGMLADKFLLERRLGRGGMGAVYLARDLGLQRHVAVKTLPFGAGPGLVRLTQEARAMAAVAHPAIAQIHGLEEWRGRPLLVVEFLQGGTLAGPPRSWTAARCGGGRRGRDPVRGTDGIARRRLCARRRQAEQHRLCVGRGRQVARFRSGPSDERRRSAGRRNLVVHVARSAVRGTSRRGRRHLVAVRGAVRDGRRAAPVHRHRRPRGGRLHPAATDPSGGGWGGGDETDGLPEFCEGDRVRRFDPGRCTVGATRDGTCVRRCATRTLSGCSVCPSRTFTHVPAVPAEPPRGQEVRAGLERRHDRMCDGVWARRARTSGGLGSGNAVPSIRRRGIGDG